MYQDIDETLRKLADSYPAILALTFMPSGRWKLTLRDTDPEFCNSLLEVVEKLEYLFPN